MAIGLRFVGIRTSSRRCSPRYVSLLTSTFSLEHGVDSHLYSRTHIPQDGIGSAPILPDRISPTTLPLIVGMSTARTETHANTYHTIVLRLSYSAGIARIANLHRKWMIATPEGAMSVQCQELNALHSLCVDGGSIKIPQRLENPPEDAAKPFVLDVLATDARAFAQSFARMRIEMEEARSADEDPEVVLKQLLESDVSDQRLAFSEDELVGFILSAWRRNKVDPYKFLPLINWSGVSAMTKHALYATLLINTAEHPYIWNRFVAIV